MCKQFYITIHHLSVQDQFIAHGGILQDEEKVLRIVPGNIVTVVTNKGQYRAKSVAITAGPWSAKLLNSLGVFPPIKVIPSKRCFLVVFYDINPITSKYHGI